jgi:putative mRNA 3-end processing factor
VTPSRRRSSTGARRPATQITAEDTAHDETVRILYIGDVSTRDRFYLDVFEPVDADILVVEATYGTPEYVFPPQDVLEARIVDWFEDTADRPVICMGYTLGRAQEIQVLAQRAGRSRLLVTDAIAEINAVIESHLDVDFGAESYERRTDLSAGDVLVLPGQTNSLSFVQQLRDSTDAIKAGFSGWAIDSSFKFRGDHDETLVLSDHCGHDELLDLVRSVDPDQVYVQHGAVDEFAGYLNRETPYRAQSLQRNQTTLGDF